MRIGACVGQKGDTQGPRSLNTSRPTSCPSVEVVASLLRWIPGGVLVAGQAPHELTGVFEQRHAGMGRSTARRRGMANSVWERTVDRITWKKGEGLYVHLRAFDTLTLVGYPRGRPNPNGSLPLPSSNYAPSQRSQERGPGRRSEDTWTGNRGEVPNWSQRISRVPETLGGQEVKSAWMPHGIIRLKQVFRPSKRANF